MNTLRTNFAAAAVFSAALMVLLPLVAACSTQSAVHQIPDASARGDNVVYEVEFDGL